MRRRHISLCQGHYETKPGVQTQASCEVAPGCWRCRQGSKFQCRAAVPPCEWRSQATGSSKSGTNSISPTPGSFNVARLMLGPGMTLLLFVLNCQTRRPGSKNQLRNIPCQFSNGTHLVRLTPFFRHSIAGLCTGNTTDTSTGVENIIGRRHRA